MEHLILDTSSVLIYIPKSGFSTIVIIFGFTAVGLGFKIFERYKKKQAYRETVRRRLGL